MSAGTNNLLQNYTYTHININDQLWLIYFFIDYHNLNKCLIREYNTRRKLKKALKLPYFLLLYLCGMKIMMPTYEC